MRAHNTVILNLVQDLCINAFSYQLKLTSNLLVQITFFALR